MKAKKLLALLLTICMVVSLFPMAYAADEAVSFWDLKNTDNVSTEELAITVDGEATKVTHYNGYYYDENEENTLTVGPGKYGPGGDRDDCQISIYVPEDATSESGVMFLIENGSWAQTGFKEVIADGQEFDSTQNDRVALALAHDMIVVSYGARCRGSVDAEGNRIHAPQMVVDTKAAIRYVKYNIGLGNIPGDADKVIISGHSGGGALTAIIAATGNSPDFDEYLVNAAPATDDVLATMSSAPITDLAMADFAYEWTFGDYRDELPDFLSYKEKGCDLELSAALAAKYVPYVESMFGLTEEEYTAKITEIFAASVQHEINLAEEFQFGAIRPEADDRGFFTLDENGDVASFDLDAYTKWLVNNASQGAYPGNELKGVIAFNGEKVDGGYMRNENNLWGAADQVASVAYEELWSKADLEAMGIDAYESWDAFWAAEGEMVAKQMKSVSVMPYLTGSDDAWYLEGIETSDECDVAPYWFIRHGMGDADTSYATVASLIMAVEEKAEDVNAYFGWERSHNGGGNTYYHEFFQWMENKGIIGDPFSVEYAEEANTLNITVDGEAVTVERYNDYYYSAAEGDTTSVGPGKYGPGGDRDDCQISIYVPEDATSESGVMFLIENGSWAQTGFKEVIADGQEFDSTQNDRVALALAHDMIVVSYGARCRGSVDAEGNRIHAPQMVVDTKAAIRYVKYNIEQGLIPGDADKVIISGHSGGGALTAIIAATGNSPDFDEYLVNAAPATDDVLATMSSAPITDLAMADFAYEWTFGDYRDELPDFISYKEKGCDLELSAALAAKYVPYVESMFGLTEEEYTAKITEIFAASVQHEIDLAEEFQFSDIRPETDERGFFTLDENGDVASFDLDAYTQWLVNNASQGAYPGNEMKGVIAFNGEKVEGGYMRNENNLWGAADQVASVAYEELWEKADLEAMGIDAYESWDAFWAAEGEMLAKQMKSVSVMPYLTGSDDAWYLEGVETSDESDVAPYWFIRHGMGDADTSYATVASLIMAVEEKAEHVNAYFGWERSHNGGGNTYYQEFFQWMEDEGVLSTADIAGVAYVPNANEYQTMDIYMPEGEAPAGGWPVYIYVHGGGFTKGDKAEKGSSLNSALAALEEGYAVAAVNYTVTGEISNDIIVAEIVDVMAAVRYLQANADEYGFNAEKLVLTGPSAGGGLAEIAGMAWNSDVFDDALAAIGAAEADGKVAAIVAYAGAGHFNGQLTTTSIEALADSADPAMFLRHGDVDPVVECSVSEAVVAAARAAGIVVDFEKVEGAKHTFQNFFALYDVADTFAWLDYMFDAETAVLSSQSITVKDQAAEAEIYNIAGHNYFKLRDIAALLVGTYAEFGVEFDAETKEVYVTTGADYVAVGGELEAAGDQSATCGVSTFDIYVDGEQVEVVVYNIGGNNYLKLRDLGEVIGFPVSYDEATKTIEIL